MKKWVICCCLLLIATVMIGVGNATTIEDVSIVREVSIGRGYPDQMYSQSFEFGVFNETITNSNKYAEAWMDSNATFTGDSFISVTAEGGIDVDPVPEIYDNYSTSELRLAFTIDGPAYYYFNPYSGGHAYLWNDDHDFVLIGEESSGILPVDTYELILGIWEARLPLEEYAGTFILSLEPIPAIPEPATMLLLGFGLIGLAATRRKF